MLGYPPGNDDPARTSCHRIRFSLHDLRLQGLPDLVVALRRAVIFVHGRFRHGYECSLLQWPGTRPEFWRAKIDGNVARDARVRSDLLTAGWRVMDVWECDMRGKGPRSLESILAACAAFLNSDAPFASLGDDLSASTEHDDRSA